ncbi:MAG: sugar phosphate isomerase/epimerase [Chloroflexi bacterium]|nr:sugar phosphate isomerase/epimerase [Chloroflexota bacterium]
MKPNFNRRDFLTATTTLATGLGLGFSSAIRKSQAAEPVFKTKLHKALIMNHPSEEGLRKLKEAGFDGVEAGILSPDEAGKCRALADKLGLRIHSVLRGWAEFNSPDPAKVEETFATSEAALRAAHAFGADAVLLVPCRIGGMKMPRPWEFLLEFDEPTGHLTKVAYGDNAPYAEYIKAHNHATDTSRELVKRLIPLAEKTGVIIALENVWNNLWVKPSHFKHFVASFQSPWVKAYFDIGNHVKYAPPEDWILALGDLIVKCHVKDFKLNPSDPNGQGSFVNIRDGSIRWPVVRSALDAAGYNGWMTIEGGDLSLEEHSRRLDLILAGK